MSNTIFIVIVEDDRYGVEILNVYSDLDQAIESIPFVAERLAEQHHFDLYDPDNEDFVQWGRDKSYCNIEDVGSVWIADCIVDYVE